MSRPSWNVVAGLVVGALLAVSVSTAQAQKDEKLIHAAIKPVPRDAGWVKRHEGFNEEAKKGNIDLVFIGDSITDGWRGAGKAAWEKYYTPRKALNLGIGGDRTQHVLWRLQNGNLDGIKPKLAVIMIGTNNSNGKDNTSEEIADGIKAIISTIRTKTPDTKILLLAIFPRGAGPSPQREKNAQASELASKVADDKMVFYIDFGKKFLTEDGTLSKEVMPDLLHLNAKSYETWAEAIEPKVKELLGEK